MCSHAWRWNWTVKGPVYNYRCTSLITTHKTMQCLGNMTKKYLDIRILSTGKFNTQKLTQGTSVDVVEGSNMVRLVTVNQNSFLYNTTFGSRASFLCTTFGSRTSFLCTTFGSRASFLCTTFGSRASFLSTTFGSRASFLYTTFWSRATMASDTEDDVLVQVGLEFKRRYKTYPMFCKTYPMLYKK